MNKKELTLASVPTYKAGKGAMFLLNTHLSRSTEPLVNLFLEKCKKTTFEEKIRSELAVYSDACIEAFLSEDKEILTENFRKISDFQYRYFQEMIPNNTRQIWSNGLASGDYLLKLCGAGGGGFMLGFTENLEQLNSQDIEIIYRV